MIERYIEREREIHKERGGERERDIDRKSKGEKFLKGLEIGIFFDF